MKSCNLEAGKLWRMLNSKNGQYVYYRCTRSRGKCHEPPIRGEELARQLGEPLKRLRITPERTEWILEALKASHADEGSSARRNCARSKRNMRSWSGRST